MSTGTGFSCCPDGRKSDGAQDGPRWQGAFWQCRKLIESSSGDLKKVLLQSDFSGLPGLVKNRAQIISRVMEIAEKNNDTIFYAP
ncbi:MAG: hypothetical protein GEU76_15420 [Alphaproteobacteria bacterium]|nr:hypothetical protein [Alphaproteobacteria bacterium]